MPRLIRLYIIQAAIGFGLSALFVGLLLGLDVAGLGHLVAASEAGWLAVLMLFVGNGVVFAGVQFAITVMRMQQDEVPPQGGRRIDPALRPMPVPVPVPVPVPARGAAGRRDRRNRVGG